MSEQKVGSQNTKPVQIFDCPHSPESSSDEFDAIQLLGSVHVHSGIVLHSYFVKSPNHVRVSGSFTQGFRTDSNPPVRSSVPAGDQVCNGPLSSLRGLNKLLRNLGEFA